MFLSTPVKVFHAALFLSIVFAGCSVWRGNENSTVSFASQPKSEYPFVNREPEIFQTELVVRTGETERRMLIARNGDMRRVEFDVGTDDHRAVLITDKEYLLFFKRKVYEERSMTSTASAIYEPLTAPILNLRDYADFAEIERVGSVVEYSARINDSPNSEVRIFFDVSIGLPVRQEFYSIEGDQRRLQYSVEFLNFRKAVDDGIFEIPPGFKRGPQSRERKP